MSQQGAGYGVDKGGHKQTEGAKKKKTMGTHQAMTHHDQESRGGGGGAGAKSGARPRRPPSGRNARVSSLVGSNCKWERDAQSSIRKRRAGVWHRLSRGALLVEAGSGGDFGP